MFKKVITILCVVLLVSTLFATFTLGRLYQAVKYLESTTIFYQENIYRMLEESV